MQEQHDAGTGGAAQGEGMTIASGARRQMKHPGAEVRRLLVAAAKALPLRRPSWLDKPESHAWK